FPGLEFTIKPDPAFALVHRHACHNRLPIFSIQAPSATAARLAPIMPEAQGLGKPQRLVDKTKWRPDGKRMAANIKHVNMADINSTPPGGEALPLDIMGLFFFAYRDFTGDADALLGRQDFGRAHHRVLYFVNLRPGMPVADLLDILKITKQSLARVLRQLIDNGYI